MPRELKNQKPMVAILPFKNLNANEDSAFLIDGIFEDILTELSMVRQVSIVSRQSSMNFTESGADLDQFISQFSVNFLSRDRLGLLGLAFALRCLSLMLTPKKFYGVKI